MKAIEHYQAIVVGSGAAGGWAAKELAERGVKTLLLEAGRSLDIEADFARPRDTTASKIQLVSRARAVLTGQHVQARCMSFSPLTKHLFVSDWENPYNTGSNQPFNWYRGRQVGGRLHLWGRNALRISDQELKPAVRDGYGQNWPIAYADLAPWYEKVELFLGVCGSAAGIATIPDGKYCSPHALTQAEARVLGDLKTKWSDRPATTCRIIRHNAKRIPLPILAGLATGNLTLRSDAVVSHIVPDPATGKAIGVIFVDRKSREMIEVRADSIVLCASAIESLRILLNSRCPRHPRGIGNSTGQLGRGITDHVMVFRAGPYSPLEKNPKVDDYDFGAQSGIYIPNFRNTGNDRQKDFLRGYSLLGSIARIEPGWFFMAIGEMLPRDDNFVETDPSRQDAWGIPVAKIHCAHSENERAMVRDMKRTLDQLAQDCGLQNDHLQKESQLSRLVYRMAARLVYTPEGALVPGSAVHECGGAPMGDDPKSSVLNKFNQCWDAPNVFVTDSASFTTSPYQNPGLTIMALSARGGNFIADQIEKGGF